MKRRRRVSPDKLAMALGGPDPGRFGNPRATGNACARCEETNATVPPAGGLCLRCRQAIPAPFPGG